jgi:hypothetical protein
MRSYRLGASSDVPDQSIFRADVRSTQTLTTNRFARKENPQASQPSTGCRTLGVGGLFSRGLFPPLSDTDQPNPMGGLIGLSLRTTAAQKSRRGRRPNPAFPFKLDDGQANGTSRDSWADRPCLRHFFQGRAARGPRGTRKPPGGGFQFVHAYGVSNEDYAAINTGLCLRR